MLTTPNRHEPVARFRWQKCLQLCLISLALGVSALAGKIPLKMYTTADGLVSDSVSRIVVDSRGFLWFCTSEGLSRFDGYRFKNYTQEQGLPHRSVNDLFETKDGELLVATSGGLVAFNPLGKAFRWNLNDGRLDQNTDEPPMFRTFIAPDAQTDSKISKSILNLASDAKGEIYAGTTHGVYRLAKSGADWRLQAVESEIWKNREITVNFLFTDSRKNLWIGANVALYMLGSDGVVREIADKGANKMFEDRSGNLWVDSGGNEIGTRIYAYRDGDPVPALVKTYTTADGFSKNVFTTAIAQMPDGRIIVSSNGQLFESVTDAQPGKPSFRLLENEASTSARDFSGNLWFNSPDKGVGRFSPNSFIVFGERDGLPVNPITSIFGNDQGDVFLTAGDLVKIGENKIETVKPKGFGERNWLETYLDFQSRDGEFWIPTKKGLLRYPKVANFADLANTAPKKVYTTADGLFSDVIDTIYEDSRGDVWITAPDGKNTLLRWEKRTGEMHRYTIADGLPELSGAVSFGEDASGSVWIGFYYGQILRYKNGKFEDLTEQNRVPRAFVTKFLTDLKGRLWLSTLSRGLFRVDAPEGDQPQFVNISTADGLSSNQALCLAEDVFGRIYAGTGRGINRLEPENGRVKVFTPNDGLPGSVISKCYSDKNGNLWFSSHNSLVKYVPSIEMIETPPPIYIDAVSINGRPQPVSELGEREIKNIDFDADERQLQISFFAISFNPGETLRYQYKLNEQDWSEANEQRTVNFNLSPGSYNFAVRAVTADGITSETASVSFAIARPLWQRWWFLGLAFLLVSSAILLLDRYRVTKTKEVAAALESSRESERVARESENRFRTLAQTASDAIITIDTESRIVFVNEAVEKIFGWTASDLVGENLARLMPSEFRGKHQAGFERYLSTSTKNIAWNGIEIDGLHRSGALIPIEISFGEFELDGKRYFTGVARDITERRRAEEALQQAREERIAELQKIRQRIATDLHDDIGSSLTQIAVLTEVVRSQAPTETIQTPLEKISDVSGELVDAMADIVWAINPKKDNLRELVLRMRRFASDVFSAREIEFEFETSEEMENFSLGANIRREVFSIYKECVNNIVRHSGATEVQIDFAADESLLRLEIKDNGRGFDVEKVLSEDFSPDKGGNGLVNMRRRAAEAGGMCEIVSGANGTRTKIEIPTHVKQTGEDIHITLAGTAAANLHVNGEESNGNGR